MEELVSFLSGKLVLALRKDCLTPRRGHTTHLGSMLELTLLSRHRQAHAEGVRAGELTLLHHLLCDANGERKMPSSAHPMLSMAGERRGPEVTRV